MTPKQIGAAMRNEPCNRKPPSDILAPTALRPKGTKARLLRDAKANHRSLTAHVNWILLEYLKTAKG